MVSLPISVSETCAMAESGSHPKRRESCKGLYMNGIIQQTKTYYHIPHLFLSNFHFHIFPSHLFLSPFRSSGAFSSSTHPFSLTFLAAPLPIIPFVVSNLAAAIRSCLTRPRSAESSVRRSMRCERSVSSDSAGVERGFLGLDPEGFGSAHPRSTDSSAGAPFIDGVASTSSHCSTERQYSSLKRTENSHSSLPSTKMTCPEGAAFPFPFLELELSSLGFRTIPISANFSTSANSAAASQSPSPVPGGEEASNSRLNLSILYLISFSTNQRF